MTHSKARQAPGTGNGSRGRVQRSRAKGWRMPENAVYVGRPSKWGNPFPLEGDWIEWAARAFGYKPTGAWLRGTAIALYRWWLTGEPPVRGFEYDYGLDVQITFGTKGGAVWIPGHGHHEIPLPPDLAPLRGKTLVCWCPAPWPPCHADVLLELLAEGPE